MNQKILTLVVFISALMLMAGLFSPLTRIPIYGDLSYYRISPYETYFVILFAVLGPALILINKQKLLLLAPLGVWITLFFHVLKSYFKPEKSSVLGKMNDKLVSVMQDNVVDLLLKVLELNWGGYLFIAGLFLFTISCVLRSLK